MEFDWSEDKRRRNLDKHGLDFALVPFIDWDSATILEDRRADYGEARYWAFGMMEQRLHLVAFTVRNDKIRVISFRKASRKEAQRYGKT